MPTHSSAQYPMQRPKSSKILRKTAAIVIAIVVLALIVSYGLSYYVGYTLTHPVRAKLTGSPTDLGLSYKNISFPSRSDKLQIDGWLVPASMSTDKIVIESHGYRGNRTKDEPALPTMKALHDAGFTVLSFDYRDEGVSPGKLVSVGYYEVRDLLGAVDYAKSLGYKHIGVIGFSMGASTALQAAIQDPDINAVISDSPFANLYSYLSVNMPVWTHLPNWPFTSEILWEMKVFTGLDAAKVDPLGGLAHWQPRPLLLIAGTADTTIPMRNSQALYKEVKSNPEDSIWIVPGAKHVGAYKVAPAAYEDRVTSFFTQALQ